MKSWLLLIVLLAAINNNLNSYQLVSTAIEPETIYIGDIVQLNLLLQTEDENLQIPQQLPQNDAIKLLQVQVDSAAEQQVLVKVKLQVFQTGELTVPALTLGNTSLTPSPIKVLSLLTDKPKILQREQPPLLVPGTLESALFYAFLAALIPWLLLKFILPRGRRLVQQSRQAYRTGKKIIWFRRKLARTKAKLDDTGQLYTDLSQTIRQMLEFFLNFPCQAATTTELSSLTTAINDRHTWQQLIKYLQQADLVRYSAAQINAEQSRQHLTDLIGLSRKISRLQLTGQ